MKTKALILVLTCVLLALLARAFWPAPRSSAIDLGLLRATTMGAQPARDFRYFISFSFATKDGVVQEGFQVVHGAKPIQSVDDLMPLVEAIGRLDTNRVGNVILRAFTPLPQ
jgi:hypothetical protein